MKSLFSTIPHHVHLRMPPVAPRGRLEAPESADVRLQLSAWYSLSRFAAGSLPTPPGFQAAALRFNNTKSFYTTNEIHCTIVNPSTPDEARQTIDNSNRASMNYTLNPSHHAAPSCKHPSLGSALPLVALFFRSPSPLSTSSSTAQARADTSGPAHSS
jgi:hypothetical protein